MKSYAEMTNIERAALARSNPKLFAQTRAEYLKNGDAPNQNQHRPPTHKTYGQMSNLERRWLATNDPERFERERAAWLRAEREEWAKAERNGARFYGIAPEMHIR